MTEMATITISKEGAQVSNITTSGYILLYMIGDRINFKGDIAMSSLAPYLVKILAEKLAK